MLANFYLSTFDIEMQRRGLEVIRYADDFVVMCESEQHAFVIAKGSLEGELELSMHRLGIRRPVSWDTRVASRPLAMT